MILFEAFCHLYNPQKSKVRYAIVNRTGTHTHITNTDAHTHECPFHSFSYITLMQETAWLRHPGPILWLPFTSACRGIHSFITMLSWWPVCQLRWIMWKGSTGLGEDLCVFTCLSMAVWTVRIDLITKRLSGGTFVPVLRTWNPWFKGLG